LPPDVCIEIALWERFGWGPKDTDDMPLRRMRELFAVLEQQRSSRNAIDMGPPSYERMAAIDAKKKAEEAAKKIVDKTNNARKEKSTKRTDKGGNNAATDKGK
jgi:ribulose bisphosphate carboxylase small subunit